MANEKQQAQDPQETSDRKQNVVTPIVMNLDGDPSTIKPQEFSFVLNAVPEKDVSGNPFMGNEGANGLTGVVFPDGYIVHGNRRINSDSRVVFLVNMAAQGSEIGLVVKGLYYTKINDPGLNFHIAHSVCCRVKVMFNGNTIVYWTDNYNPMRWINLDKIPYIKTIDLTNNIVDSTVLDTAFIKVFKSYSIPYIDVTGIQNRGALKTGGYFITGQYADGRGNGLTACFKLSNKVPIYRDSVDEAFETITGNASGVPTDKAIEITISNPDLSFTHLNIFAIRQVDGVNTAYKAATIPINQHQYILSGAETEVPALLEDVLADAAIYDTAKAVEESDGSLVWVNLKGMATLNLQPYVSKVQVQWQAYRTSAYNKVLSHKNPLFSTYNQSYRRDEVVPLALVFQLVDGTDTNAYPLVGRAMNKKSSGQPFQSTKDQYGNTVDPTTWDSGRPPVNADLYEGQSLPRWTVYNTATVEGDKSLGLLTEGLSFYGEMAYWQSTERYPSNTAVWGALANTFIRFPKMPDSSILHLHDGKDGSRTLKSDLYLYHLGIILPNINQVLGTMPPEIRSRIAGWKLVRADRQFNKSVMASGIMINTFSQDFSTVNKGTDIRLYPNFPLNDLRADSYINDTIKTTQGGGIIGTLLGQDARNTNYQKDTFTFFSPDTTLNRTPLSNAEIRIDAELYGSADCYHEYLDPYPKLNQSGSTNVRAILQATAIGWYNNYKTIRPGQARRKLLEATYIPFNAQVSGGNAGHIIWNKQRESSVLLKTGTPLLDPQVQDRTKFILTNEDNKGLTPQEAFTQTNPDAGDVDIYQHKNRPTSLYYATLKRNLPNQYGTLYNIKFVDTGYNDQRYANDGIILGGDTYICLFAVKRQMPLATDLQKWIGAPDGGDGMDTLATESIPGVRYFYRNTVGNAIAHSHMMGQDNSGFNPGILGGLVGLLISDPKHLGYLTSVMFGIPVFWCESDVNADIRYEGQATWEADYPSLLNGALNTGQWTCISNIDRDNAYYANQDLSGYNNLKYYSHDDLMFEPGNDTVSRFRSRAIKSLRSQPEDLYDNWQVYKPLDYYDFLKSRGQIIDVRYIGEYRTIFRMEEALFVTQLFQTMSTSGAEVVLGTGRLFTQEPYEVNYTELGYSGTENQWACDVTEHATYFVNSKMGKVFSFVDPGRMYNLSRGFKDLADKESKAERWFYENLPFKLSTQVDGVDVDNPYNPNGIGCHSTYDAKNKLWILTKKDYELLDKTLVGRVTYVDGNYLKDGQPVSLNDNTTFINRSFTIAFSPLHNGWVSFKSYIPDMYFSGETTFASILNANGKSQVYEHNLKGKYLEFYGKQAPFILEMVTKGDGLSAAVTEHVTFLTKAFTLSGRTMKEVINRTFNKAAIYNLSQHSGDLNLIVQDENNLSTLYSQLGLSNSSRDVSLRYREGRWNFSDFFDIVQTPGLIYSTEWVDIRSRYFIDKVLSNANLDYTSYLSVSAMIRGQFTKIRLVLDNATDLKLLFQVGMEETRGSYA